jgi:signal peptidase I
MAQPVPVSPTAPAAQRGLQPVSLLGVLLALLVYVAAMVPSVLTRVLWVEAFETDGPSMEPSLLDGDRFVLDRTAVGLHLPGDHESVTHWASPAVGDMVVLYSPMDEVEIVKRVIGVGGDRVSIEAGIVSVNGVSLGHREIDGCPMNEDAFERVGCFEEHHGNRVWRVSHEAHERDAMSEVEVPEGHVFVLGDHRDRSNDSRNPLVGTIPISRVVGVVWARYWSETGQPLGVFE